MKFLLPKLSFNINSKISLEYIGAFLLIVFCNFWLYQAKPVTPLYYFFFVSLFIFIISFIRQKSVQITSTQITSLFCAFYIFIVSIFHKDTSVNTVLHTGVTFIFYFLTIYFLKFLNKEQVLNITKWLFSFTFIYTLFESFWRWTHPTMFREGVIPTKEIENSFYMFKTNSFMFQDSNFVSLITLIMTFLAFYILTNIKKGDNFYKFMFIAFAVLTGFTISRAAIFAMIVSVIAYYSFDTLKGGLRYIKNITILTFRMVIFIPLAIIGTFIFLYGIYLFMSDGSFLTKIEIFTDLLEYLHSMPLLNKLLGCGSDIGNMLYYFGRATHALIPTYIVWYGIIELCLILFFWIQIAIDTNYKSLLTFIAIFIVGFSLSSSSTHILYVSLAIITYFENIMPQLERSIECH